MHVLSFEHREGGWDIYLGGRDKPIGDISLAPDQADGWIGRMTLDGRHVLASRKTPQDIIDEINAWVAAGMPSDSPLLELASIRILLGMDQDLS
jgi:hypothetical protein